MPTELDIRTELVKAMTDIDKATTISELRTALKMIVAKLVENGQLPKSIEKWD